MAYGDPEFILKLRWWRVVLAFLLAPVVPAALVVLAISPAGLQDELTDLRFWQFVSLIVMVAGYPPSLLIGLPLYFALKRRARADWWIATFAGGACAAIPWVYLLVWGGLFDGLASERPVPFIGFSSIVFGLGLIGGFSFWVIAIAGGKPSKTGAWDERHHSF